MKGSNLGRLLAGVLVLASATGARAQEASAPETGLLPSGHRLTLYTRAGGSIYLSDVRTAGGIGGGVGVRDTIQDRFILQADVNYLMMLGNVGTIRLGAGVQRRGTYTPAVLVTLTTFVGRQLTFLTPEHPTPVRAPAMALGVSVAPLRFTQDGLQLSLLELGVGAGPEFPGLGLAWQLGLVEVGTSF